MGGYSFHGILRNLSTILRHHYGGQERIKHVSIHHGGIEIQSKKKITRVIGDEEEAQGGFYFVFFFLFKNQQTVGRLSIFNSKWRVHVQTATVVLLRIWRGKGQSFTTCILLPQN